MLWLGCFVFVVLLLSGCFWVVLVVVFQLFGQLMDGCFCMLVVLGGGVGLRATGDN